jgi:DNA-binding protein H-NS
VLQVAKGNAFLIKKDIFKNLMWYTLPDSNKQYPLTIERVRKIKSLNQQGITPEELEPVEVATGKPKEAEPETVELVGQISLRTLEKAEKKKKQQQQQRNQANRQMGQRPQQRQQGGQQHGGAQQQKRQQGGQHGNKQQRNPQRPGNPNRNQQRPNNPNPGKDKQV